MNIAPWHFDKREPSTAAIVISEADILKAADALADCVDLFTPCFNIDCDGVSCGSCNWMKICTARDAYRKSRKGER